MANKNDNIRVSVSNKTVVRIIAIILLSFIFIKLVVKIDHILQLIFLSFFLAIALNPAVSSMSHHLKIKSRALATGIAYLVVIIILGLFIGTVFPPLIKQSVNFTNDLPKTISTLRNPNSSAGKAVKKYHLTTEVNSISTELTLKTKNVSVPSLATAARIGGILTSIIVVIVLTFMMLVEGPGLLNRYWELRFGEVEWHQDLARRMYKIVTGYVNGQVLLALIGGLFAFVTLIITSRIFGVTVNSVALAGIILFTGLIPMIGHLIGGVVVALACLFVSWPLAVVFAVAFIIYLQIENATFQPYIQAKFNELSPLLVFVAALVGISAGGLLGAFVAIPLAGCFKLATKDIMIRRKIVSS